MSLTEINEKYFGKAAISSEILSAKDARKAAKALKSKANAQKIDNLITKSRALFK